MLCAVSPRLVPLWSRGPGDARVFPFRASRVSAYALIDDEDVAMVAPLRWFPTRGHRGQIRPAYWDGERNVRMYHLLLGLRPSRRLQVDHINGDTLDNRRANLRVVTNGQNQQNRTHRSYAKSGVRGVYWHKDVGRWAAGAMVEKRSYHLGFFDSVEEAAEVVQAFRREHMPFSEADKRGACTPA